MPDRLWQGNHYSGADTDASSSTLCWHKLKLFISMSHSKPTSFLRLRQFKVVRQISLQLTVYFASKETFAWGPEIIDAETVATTTSTLTTKSTTTATTGAGTTTIKWSSTTTGATASSTTGATTTTPTSITTTTGTATSSSSSITTTTGTATSSSSSKTATTTTAEEKRKASDFHS